MKEEWLHGWRRNGATVLIIFTVHCAGCGRIVEYVSYGLMIPEDWVQPPEPDWPFSTDDCPICEGLKVPVTVNGLSQLPWSMLREAIQLKKIGV